MLTASRTPTRSEEPAPPLVEYSGIVTRGIAFAVDAAIVNGAAIVVAGATALVISLFPGNHKLHALEVAIAGVAFVIWLVAYFATFWSTTGQTPGDRVMQIRVTRPDGSRLRAGRAVVRMGAMVLAAIPLFAGFVPIVLTQRRRGLPDWIADTVVTRASPPAITTAGAGPTSGYGPDGQRPR
jgi:uncharacterized RDD family membrane protein YckC